ncbi:hypothetical protein BKA64DRAFT_692510 [Cadophora sp. MPI-SDFR-AT-0126]|nr:hypothetical protein BKA64DRAFT_692510 [Leotiomycetes sp. MPI-SDFR-AT-0126]
MPQAPRKRSRSSKYASKEEKAREDVIKKRAGRRLQSAAARQDIRFRFYNTEQIQAMAMAPLSVHQAHLQSLNGLDILADAATSRSRVAVSELARLLVLAPNEISKLIRLNSYSTNEEAGDEGIDSDFEFLLKDAFETDSDLEPDFLLDNNEMDTEDGLDIDHLCNCKKEENTKSSEELIFSLKQMAEYWQNLGMPDAIGPASLSPKAGKEESTHIEYNPSIKRTWDIDSIISWASCLSINQGLYVSVYVFFPGISHVCRTTSYLTRDERRIWVNRLLLPAIRRICSPNVIQYHPRSFDDVESKAYSRRQENCSSMVQNDIDMHHYLPLQYLEAI